MNRLSSLILLALTGTLLARTELVQLRTADSRTFDNGDGTYTAEIVAGFDDSLSMRPVSSGTGWVMVERVYPNPDVYTKRPGALRYLYAPGSSPPDYMESHGWAKFDLDSLPRGLEVTSAVLRFYQYQTLNLPATSVDHLRVDPTAVSPEALFRAVGVQICSTRLHADTGWVEHPFNYQGRENLMLDGVKGWSAYRINREADRITDGYAYGVGHLHEPRIEVTYRLPHNAAAVSIQAPVGMVDTGTIIVPRAVITNLGGWPETFGVKMAVGERYLDSCTVTLQPVEVDTIEFARWTAVVLNETLAVRCSTMLGGDEEPEDDTATASVWTAVGDVGVYRIVEPAPYVLVGSLVTPEALLTNLGTRPHTCSLHFRIGDAYVCDTVTTVPAQSSDTVRLAEWLSQACTTYEASCWVSLPGDADPSNDTAWKRVTVFGDDAKAMAILAPVDTVEFGSAVAPRASIRNRGYFRRTIPVRFAIGGFYSEIDSIDIRGGGTGYTEFEPWTVSQPGRHAVRCSTMLDGDIDPSNDCVSGWVVVESVGGVAEYPEAEFPPGLSVIRSYATDGFIVLRHNLPTATSCCLTLCDATGRSVERRELALPDRRGSVSLDLRHLSAGVYFCRLTAGSASSGQEADGFTATQKLIIQR